MRRNHTKLPDTSKPRTLAKQSVEPSPLFDLFTKNSTMAVYVNQFISWDTNLCIHINRYSTNYVIATFFKVVSRLGDGWFWYLMLISAFVLNGLSAIIPLVSTLVISLSGLAIYKLLKVKTVRPRPYQVHQVIVLGERPLDVFSFPSGHTLQAVLFTSTLGSYFPELLPIMLPFALLVALSRMVLGLHYPTDVLIGACIGYALSLWVTDVQQLIEQAVVVIG
ncbi:phosphatase PAP2 family protein [Psychrobacter sp. FDAARGOS_221]|uniref:phosphatase PAP2 family protein n=1 Tax=Psychrobacter sp. FDAARGOS_221 TaxID=1975705 RepID=UPI0026A8374B